MHSCAVGPFALIVATHARPPPHYRERLDALAGLRPWLLTQSETLPGARVLNGSFTSVQQAIGVPRARADGGTSLFLERFVEEAKASGLVEELIDKFGVRGKLSVAS